MNPVPKPCEGKDTNKPREKSKLACFFSEAEYLRRGQRYGKTGKGRTGCGFFRFLSDDGGRYHM